MRFFTAVGAAATLLAFTSTANAQDRRDERRTQVAQPSPAAAAALASGDQPDVLLDIPNLSVDEIVLEVANLQVDIALDARLANLLKLTAGANASIEQVKLTIKGVQAQATLIVRLDNVRAIIERTLQTLDNNPQIISQLGSTLDTTLGTVGGVANNAVSTVGGVANTAVGTVGGALSTGQLLNLDQAGLTEVSRTVDSAGQTVRQVRDANNGLLEVVTDSAGRILSSRRLPGQ